MILWWIAAAFLGAGLVLVVPSRWIWRAVSLSSVGIGGWLAYEYVLRAPLEVTYGLTTLHFKLPWWGISTEAGWMSRYQVSLFFATDGAAFLLAAAATLVHLVLSFWPGWNFSQPRLQMAALLLVYGFSLWTIFAYDLIAFYVGFEAVLFPMYYLILTLSPSGEGARRAAMEFLLYTLVGSVPMLAGILYGAAEISRAYGVPFTTNYYDWIKYPLSAPAQLGVYLSFILAFWVKLGLFPLHGWVITLYRQAPLALVVLSSAILTKLGGIAWLRWAAAFPQAHFTLSPYVGGLAVISLIGAGLGAYFQKGLRGWLALGTISHLSMVGVGIAATSPAGGSGAAWMMISHAIIACLHLLLAGAIIERVVTDEIARMGGLARSMPQLTALWVLTALASVGLPGLMQFPAELLILTGSYVSYTLRRGVFIAALLGVLISALYTLPILRKVLFGEEKVSISDLRAEESVPLWILGILVVVLGFFTAPFLSEIQRTVSPLMQAILFQSLGVR
ncbi:MAG: NADH-quinone oxidoreductase subunit M [Bacteroidia bacterium]|nr:NADH-quinone oxidoreductase subunit M [Bacteroidia bacterium]